MKNQQNKPLLRKLPMLVLNLAVFILIISGGYFYYRFEKKIIRQEQYSNLKTIADLKIHQITNWREERLADANVIAENPFIRRNFQGWLLSQDSTVAKDILEQFAILRYNYKYENVIIVSDEGKLLLGLNSNHKHVDSETIEYCKKVLQDKKAFISDFYFSPAHDTIHFDIFAPILNVRNVAVAVLVLRVNPYDYLYPLIQSWPTTSKSAETLIIRKEGDSILYENELRHISNTALKLRIPLTSIKVTGVQAVLGKTGIFEGLDYRGVRVLANIRPVPGTPWFMIAKVDLNEIFSELKYRSAIIIIITLLLILFFGIGISWLYNNRQKNIYRKLLETGTKLQESQEEFRSTLYSIGDAVITTDITGCIRNMNVVAENLTGWKESDVVGRIIENIFNIVNEESHEKVENPVQRVIKEGLIVGLANHTLLISKDGKEIPIADSGASIRNGKGDITGVVLVFRDQTQERIIQKTLRESEEKFRIMANSMPQLAWVAHADGFIYWYNQRWYDYTGTKPEQMEGWGWQIVHDPAVLPKVMENWTESIAAGQPFEMSFPLRGADGLFRTFLTRVEPWKDSEGLVVQWFGTNTDVESLKQAEGEIKRLNAELEYRVVQRTAQLEASNKELEAFSYSVSHDLRAPLRHVSGYVELINKRFQSDLPQKGQHYLNSIADSVRIMGILIDDLLQFSKTGRMEMHQSDFNMNEIVKEVRESLSQDNPDRKIEWVEGELPFVNGDEAMLRLVWINLLSNAVKFTRPRKKARIEIGFSKAKKELVFFVRDNGVGFDMQYSHKLFGVFQRLHLTEEFEGTGIGLANVQRIVLRHGGRTWAEAEPDKGAVFYFSIPKK